MNSNVVDFVRLNGWNIRRVPKEEITYDLCKTAVQTATPRLTDSESILHYIPSQFRTMELCMIAVEKDGCALRDVPTELKTYALCLLAVTRKGDELPSVPKNLMDMKLVEAAVQENGTALLHVPACFRTERLLWTAIKTAPQLISFPHILSQYATPELYVYALRRSLNTLRSIEIPNEIMKIIR